MPNWHPKNNQKGTVLIWMIVWLAGMAAIYYWCVLKHIPAIEQRIESNAQTALSNGGYESIDVAVSDRIATLSGEVASEAERSTIVDTVSAAAGVRSVNDGLTILAQTSTEDTTPTTTVSADNNDNIVAKAVIPATPKTTATNSEAQDTAASSSDEQSDDQSAKPEMASDSSENQAEPEMASDSSVNQAEPEMVSDSSANQAEPEMVSDSSDTQVATEESNVSASDEEAATDNTAALDTETASTDKPTSDTQTVAEDTTESVDETNDSDAQVEVTDVAADALTAAEAEAADIENKANERIKAALAKQEQAQSNSQPEQTEQAEVAAIQMQPPTLNMQVDGNSLTIMGDLSENDDALDLIESAMGTFETPIVVNKIQTHEDRNSAPWLKELTGFLPAMQGIKNAGIRINQQQLVLSGDAISEAAHDEVINQALSSLSSLSLVERMRVTPEQVAEQAPKEEAMADKETAVVETDTKAVATEAPSSGTLDDFLADYNKIDNTAILFDPGSNRLTEDSVETVIQIATILNRHSNINIGIDGHTDNSGQSDANLRLSQERSNAVRDTLIDQGVNVERINAYGFGDGVPIADNSTPEGRRLNRRIEFNFKLDQSR